MKGLGGLKPLEMGQSAAKAIGDDIKKNLQIAKSQITGTSQTQSGTNAMQPKVPDGMGDISKMLETNQGQQNTSAPQQSQTQQPVNIQEKYADQQKHDQAELEAARKNLQQIEEEMKRLREARKQKDEQEEQQEEHEKEQEELWKKEEQKQQPISAGQRSGEVKGNKG